MISLLLDPALWIAFLTLTALELVLGIDNIIFISILVDKLPQAQRERARRLGLFLAMFMRIGLLLLLSWLVGLVQPLFTLYSSPDGMGLVAGALALMPDMRILLALSGRDLILVAGGLFLIWKSVNEIHQLLEGEEGHASSAVKASLQAVILQIMLIDLVFSLDSIITAVGMVDHVEVMIAAVIASVGLMMLFAPSIGRFVSAHPTIKVLALSFLIVVGLTLLLEGFGQHVPKGYIYFAMAFSVGVEMVNIRLRRKMIAPVKLHEPYR